MRIYAEKERKNDLLLAIVSVFFVYLHKDQDMEVSDFSRKVVDYH